MTDITTFTVRRILVPLGAPGQTSRTLEMAARLAAGFHAELVGVYLREPEFLQAAALPVSRFSYSARSDRQMPDVANMERALRVRAAQLRAALESTARRMNLRWSFQDMTGSIDEMIDKAVHDFDLVTLGQLGQVSPQSTETRAAFSFFTTRRMLQSAAPIAVLLDDGGAALETAALLARLLGRDLSILLTPRDPGSADKQLADVKVWLDTHDQAAQIFLPHAADDNASLAALEEIAPQLLVMSRDNKLRREPGFGALMNRLACPLFLVAG